MFLVAMLSGCTTTGKKQLTEDVRSRIRTIALVVNIDKHELVLFNRLGKTYYTAGQYGAFGGAIEGLIKELAEFAQSKTALGTEEADLKSQLNLNQIQRNLTDKLIDRLSTDYKVIELDSSENIGREKLSLKDYSDSANEVSADAILKIDFNCGLAVYSGENTSTAITAQLSLVDLFSNKIILSKKIRSDDYFKSGHSVAEFAEDGFSLFLDGMNQSENAFALLVSNEFGLFKEEIREKQQDIEEFKAISVNCSNPYILNQDCSNWSGAKRRIQLEGITMKIAGSDDGSVILIRDEKLFRKAILEGFTLGAGDIFNKSVFKRFKLVRDFMELNGLKIKRTIKLITNDMVNGYIIEVDGDGYSLLTPNSI